MKIDRRAFYNHLTKEQKNELQHYSSVNNLHRDYLTVFWVNYFS